MNLIFICSTKKDFDDFNRIVTKSKFSADSINHEFKSFYFDCRSQEEADKLETDLQIMVNINEITGYFESEGDYE